MNVSRVFLIYQKYYVILGIFRLQSSQRVTPIQFAVTPIRYAVTPIHCAVTQHPVQLLNLQSCNSPSIFFDFLKIIPGINKMFVKRNVITSVCKQTYICH